MRRLGPCILLALATASCSFDDFGEGVPQWERTPAKRLELDPPLDNSLAPYTGWTRAHYEAVFARLLLGFVDHRSADGARTRYAGGERLPAAMEGAIRMLPALEAWLACPCNPDVVEVAGREIDVAALALAIVANGTDPRSRDYWHPISKGWDQRKVEAAAVASILVHARERVWDALDLFEQARVMTWLRAHDEPLAGNWLAFQLARDSARLALGWPVDAGQLEQLLELIEAEYAGDGFYRDSGEHRFDWYNAFVIHPLLTMWRTHVAVDDPTWRERAERIAARTRSFLGELPYLMDRNGAVAPIGRSLAYRSAVLAALQRSILAGDEFVEPGLARRMCSGSLRMHVEAGMFDADSVLTRGYQGEQPRVLEAYVRPGSQYFVSHALAVLALPPDHEFWTAPEQPLPADRGDFEHVIPTIGWRIEHDAAGVGLVLHNMRSASGKGDYHERYRKLGYAPRTWFATQTEERHPYDGTVISATQGRFDRRRSIATAWAVAPGYAWTRYVIAPEQPQPERGPAPDHMISTATLTRPHTETRADSSVRLSCVLPSPAEPAFPLEGSLALPGTLVSSEGDPLGPWAYVETSSAAILLAGLQGWTRAGPRLDWTGASPHVLGGDATWLGLGIDAPIREGRCFASLQHVEPQRFDPAAVVADAPKLEWSGTRATVSWTDGTIMWAELARSLTERVVTLDGVRFSGPLRMLSVERRGAELRVVGVGLRSIIDEHGPLLSTTAPRNLVACTFAPTKWTCEIDGPIKLARARMPALALAWREPLWLGWTESQEHVTLAGEGEWVTVEPPTSDSSTMVFELE